jgi:hypothetical protein
MYEIRRYNIRNEPGTIEGWAVIVVDSKGFLGIVSDFGSYAFHWRGPVIDFFQFLTRCDVDYLAKRLGKPEYLPEPTLRRVREDILRLRRTRHWSADKARDEWDLIEECDELCNDAAFTRWYDRTDIQDASECAVYGTGPQLRAFFARTWPRFLEAVMASAFETSDSPAPIGAREDLPDAIREAMSDEVDA